MKSAEKAKERLLGDKQSRTIDTKLEALPGYVAEESFEALAAARVKGVEYYRGQLVDQTKEKARAVLKAEGLQGEVDHLRGQLAKERIRANDLSVNFENRQGEIKSLRAELNSMTAQRNRAQKEAERLAKKLTAGQVMENAEIAQIFRNHLDESEPGDGNEWEEKARQIMWNDEDAEALREAEGIDE